MNATMTGHAVVLGGSMTGLLAARVLADRYQQVTVVDRDELPAGAAHRRGVPQGRHSHALLARGLQALDELFPGFVGELTAQGAPGADLLRDVRWHLNGHRLRQAESGVPVVSASRPFLEGHLRARVSKLAAVTIVDRCDVVGLAASADGSRVTGARILRRADGSAAEVLAADLVVDATGRGSRAGVWLSALGYEPVPQDRVRIGLGYTTRLFRLPPGALGDDIASLQAPWPGGRRGGILTMLEGDRWLLTLAGILGDHPPTDPDGFLAFARSLAFPDVFEAVADAEPIDDAVAYHFPASVRHRYERLARFPEGLLVMGDSVCSFNPLYGQGVTVAALQALTLRRHLERATVPRPLPFLRDIAKHIDIAWDMATGGDLAFPGVEGRRTRKDRVVGAYVARLHATAAHDAVLGAAFLRATGMIDSPAALLRPNILLRVLRGRRA